MTVPPRISKESTRSYELFLRWLQEVPPSATGVEAAATLGISAGNYRVIKRRHRWEERRAIRVPLEEKTVLGDAGGAGDVDITTAPTSTESVDSAGDVRDHDASDIGGGDSSGEDVVSGEVVSNQELWLERYQLGMRQLAALAPEAAEYCADILRRARSKNARERPSKDDIQLFSILVRKFLPNHLIHHGSETDYDPGGRADSLGLTSQKESSSHLKSLATRLQRVAELDSFHRDGES